MILGGWLLHHLRRGLLRLLASGGRFLRSNRDGLPGGSRFLVLIKVRDHLMGKQTRGQLTSFVVLDGPLYSLTFPDLPFGRVKSSPSPLEMARLKCAMFAAVGSRP